MLSMKRQGALALLFLAFALIVAACGSSEETTTTTSPPATEATTTTEAMAETTTTTEAMAATPIKTCLVTDLAGVDDRSFNASAWQGVQDAMAAGYATEDSFYLESSDANDWQPNIDQMVEQGCQHIVTVGFALGETTAANAQKYPDITWTMIDNILTDAEFNPLNLPNVRELVYQTDQAAFAAGYLAAGMTQTGTVCTYGGANFPTVSIFMDGFARGVDHYNTIKGTSVQVLGWNPELGDGVFTGSFTDMDVARSTAESLFQEGCDIVIPVGGAINLPAGDVITAQGIDGALIGVDADAYFAMDAQYQPLWLTTVLKAIAPLTTTSIKDHAEGTWTPGPYIGNLENDGVGLAPYHDWADRVPAELDAEVQQLLTDIKDGTVTWDQYVVG